MKLTRVFLPADFKVTDWESLKSWYDKLVEQKISSKKELIYFLDLQHELESVIEEDFAWRYIKMNVDTKNEAAKAHFLDFVENVQPKISEVDHTINLKIYNSGYLEELPDDPFLTFKRSLKSQIEIFRPENIPLQTEIEKKSQLFGEISGAMTIELDGATLTLQQAKSKLEETDRAQRESVYRKMTRRRLEDRTKLDDLMSELVGLRHKVAHNAGFNNFRDYSFASMGRFDWTVETCRNFHEVIKSEVVPLVKKIHQQRTDKLKLEKLRPWDLDVDISGKPPLKPFETSEDLVKKTITIFKKIKPEFGDFIQKMSDMGHFDLDSRVGKAPGGFQYPLYECGVPFIYMNSVGSQIDVDTMVHEGGHALHSHFSNPLKYNCFRSQPSEVAEVASMSMELLSMKHWSDFYSDEDDLARARAMKLEDAIMCLPAIARGDAWQHWLYENPSATSQERSDQWAKLSIEFGTGLIDFTDFESSFETVWHGVLHFFEIPFYYIEYGFAQLGSLSIWADSLKDEARALERYENFMKLGYTKTVPELYEAAGLDFNFSKKSVKNLVQLGEQKLNLS